jgi:hypothetical protein
MERCRAAVGSFSDGKVSQARFRAITATINSWYEHQFSAANNSLTTQTFGTTPTETAKACRTPKCQASSGDEKPRESRVLGISARQTLTALFESGHG